MKYQWRLADKNNSYYFREHNGLVVGHAYNIVHTIIWGAKIPIHPNEDLYLGQFVELEHAKKAIEEYWEREDRTLEAKREYLLSRQAF
jgi:hypothetical protein